MALIKEDDRRSKLENIKCLYFSLCKAMEKIEGENGISYEISCSMWFIYLLLCDLEE